MRILICEDEVLLALALSMILEEAGREVLRTVSRSGECLGRCHADPPDLVLVDLTLADGPTGFDLATQLSQSGIAVIIVSAEASFLPKPAPARAVIDKPYREKDVLAAVASIKPAQGASTNEAR